MTIQGTSAEKDRGGVHNSRAQVSQQGPWTVPKGFASCKLIEHVCQNAAHTPAAWQSGPRKVHVARAGLANALACNAFM